MKSSILHLTLIFFSNDGNFQLKKDLKMNFSLTAEIFSRVKSIQYDARYIYQGRGGEAGIQLLSLVVKAVP